MANENNTNSRMRTPGKLHKPGTYWCSHVVGINELEHIHASEDINLSRGDLVIISTRYGMDMAKICGQIKDTESIDVTQMRQIIRMAQLTDLSLREKLTEKENNATIICRDYINNKKLPMNLIVAHYMLDEERLVYYYTADKRIDFRNLVKDLANSLLIRIEMKHIGVRDETRIYGGVAACGRVYCCHGAMCNLPPVSIEMAKDQNLSLNTKNNIGACGRLLCCLAYEHPHYKDFRKNLPKEGVKVLGRNTSYKVSRINVIAGTVQLIAREGDNTLVSASQLVRKNNGEWKLNEEKAEQSKNQD